MSGDVAVSEKVTVEVTFNDGEVITFHPVNERSIFMNDHYLIMTHTVKLSEGKEGVVQNYIPWSSIKIVHKQWERSTASPTIAQRPRR